VKPFVRNRPGAVFFRQVHDAPLRFEVRQRRVLPPRSPRTEGERETPSEGTVRRFDSEDVAHVEKRVPRLRQGLAAGVPLDPVPELHGSESESIRELLRGDVSVAAGRPFSLRVFAFSQGRNRFVLFHLREERFRILGEPGLRLGNGVEMPHLDVSSRCGETDEAAGFPRSGVYPEELSGLTEKFFFGLLAIPRGGRRERFRNNGREGLNVGRGDAYFSGNPRLAAGGPFPVARLRDFDTL